MTKVNPHEVRDLFARLGLYPMFGQYVSKGAHCCIGTAMLADACGKDAIAGFREDGRGIKAAIKENLGWSEAYFMGVITGWDDTPLDWPSIAYIRNRPEFRDGYEHGKTARDIFIYGRKAGAA